MARASRFEIPAGAIVLYGLTDAAAVLGISATNLSNRITRGVETGLPAPRYVLSRPRSPLWTAAELRTVAADRAAAIATAADSLRHTFE